MPALLMDAQWNLLRLTQGARWLALTVLPWAAAVPEGTPMNMLDLMAHPEGFIHRMSNLREVGPTLLAHAMPHHARPHHGAPTLTTRFATVHGELAFFGMFTTFGTPQDITLASLRVERIFTADENTRAVLRAQVPALPVA